MSRRIQEDNKEFRNIVSGRIRKELKKFIRTGKLVGMRPKGGKIIINVPQIDLPTIRYGRNSTGTGAGPGDIGDIIGRDPQAAPGNQPGDTPGDVIPVGIDLDVILKFMKYELELPNLEPKDATDVFKEKIIYNGIKRQGPESLRHNRRTMRNAMLRMIQTGEYDPKNPVIVPIQDDKRYRSWNIKKIPQSNAAIFYARDWSGSMDDRKCDIVTNTAWWIDCWIRQFYERTESIYIGHDHDAYEVDQDKFYKYRYGGGTRCSSAFELIQNKIKFQFPVNQWNIYVFYFSDGENWDEDNIKCIEIIKDLQSKANLVGLGQILYGSYYWSNSPPADNDGSFLSAIKAASGISKDVVKMYDLKQDDGDDGNEITMIKEFLGKPGTVVPEIDSSID